MAQAAPAAIFENPDTVPQHALVNASRRYPVVGQTVIAAAIRAELGLDLHWFAAAGAGMFAYPGDFPVAGGTDPVPGGSRQLTGTYFAVQRIYEIKDISKVFGHARANDQNLISSLKLPP
jgi:hypothetical protein